MPDIQYAGAVTGAGSPLQWTVKSGRTLIEVRSWLPEHNTGARSVSLGGRELPGEVGATLAGPLHVLCLAPGEWLLASDEQALSITQHVAADLAEQGVVLIDGTDGFAVLRIQGAAARDVLSKGCGLDLHPHAFPAGRCARTRFAQMPVIVHCVDDPPGFDLYVVRSYLRFLADWLEDAAVEFNGDSI